MWPVVTIPNQKNLIQSNVCTVRLNNVSPLALNTPGEQPDRKTVKQCHLHSSGSVNTEGQYQSPKLHGFFSVLLTMGKGLVKVGDTNHAKPATRMCMLQKI